MAKKNKEEQVFKFNPDTDLDIKLLYEDPIDCDVELKATPISYLSICDHINGKEVAKTITDYLSESKVYGLIENILGIHISDPKIREDIKKDFNKSYKKTIGFQPVIDNIIQNINVVVPRKKSTIYDLWKTHLYRGDQTEFATIGKMNSVKVNMKNINASFPNLTEDKTFYLSDIKSNHYANLKYSYEDNTWDISQQSDFYKKLMKEKGLLVKEDIDIVNNLKKSDLIIGNVINIQYEEYVKSKKKDDPLILQSDLLKDYNIGDKIRLKGGNGNNQLDLEIISINPELFNIEAKILKYKGDYTELVKMCIILTINDFPTTIDVYASDKDFYRTVKYQSIKQREWNTYDNPFIIKFKTTKKIKDMLSNSLENGNIYFLGNSESLVEIEIV